MRPFPLVALFLLAAACGRVGPVGAMPRPAATIAVPAVDAVERVVRDALEVDVACSSVRLADVRVARLAPEAYAYTCTYVESCPFGGASRVLSARGTVDWPTRHVTLIALEDQARRPVQTKHPAMYRAR